MKLRKVNNYRNPRYPTKIEFLKNPDSLKKYLPRKWLNNKLLVYAAAIFAFLSKAEAKSSAKEIHITVDSEKDKFNEDSNIINNEIDRNRTDLVAPIFMHGGGRGATGCVVINPPAFLSEEEARQIIEEELLKENILFDKKNYKIPEAVFTRKLYGKIEKDTVNIDAFSSKHNLGYEFISSDDYFKFGGSWNSSSVQSYDVVEAAENLHEKMKMNGKINCVIFYDPMEKPEDEKSERKGYQEMVRWQYYDSEGLSEEEITARREKYKSRSIELLKKQISDFIEWAKRENLLKDR